MTAESTWPTGSGGLCLFARRPKDAFPRDRALNRWMAPVRFFLRISLNSEFCEFDLERQIGTYVLN